MFVSATRGSSLYVVAARADSGETTAFGPALLGDASQDEIGRLIVSADGARVAVVLKAKAGSPGASDRPSKLVVGDGQSWTQVYEGTVTGVQASKDLGLFAVRTSCPAATSSAADRQFILQRDGTQVLDDGDCTGTARARFVYAFAPDSSYFVLQDASTALALYAARPGATPVSVSAAGTVGRAFETSLIVFDTTGATDPSVGRWIDTTGSPLSIAGYGPSTGTPAGLLDIGTELYSMSDRKVTPLATVPPATNPDEISGVVGEGLLLLHAQSEASARVVDASGNVVGSYAADPANAPAPKNAVTMTSLEAQSLTTANAWVLVQNVYGAQDTSPNSNDKTLYSSELADDLWLLTDDAGKPASKKISLRHVATEQWLKTSRSYVASPDGKRVYYVDGSVLHAIGVTNGNDRTLGSDFQFEDIGRRCDDDCVVF